VRYVSSISPERAPTEDLSEGQQLRYCGVGVGYDDIYLQGNPAELKFIAYYIQGGRVIAVAR